MRPVYLKSILFVIGLFTAVGVFAQTCTGSLGEPVVNETFGQGADYGSIGPPLTYKLPNMPYTTDPCNDINSCYGFVTNMRGCHAGTWHVLFQDHTGNTNGYFMLVNGPGDGGEV